MEDPFPQVQHEVRTAWTQLSTSTMPESERNARLDALDQDVRDLRAALDIARAEPTRFRLSFRDISERSTFVDEMTRAISAARKKQQQQKQQDAKKTSLTSLLVSDHSHGDSRSHTHGDRRNANPQSEIRDANNAFVNEELSAQAVAIRMQDDDLDDLASAVQRIGDLGRDMHAELEEQGALLEDLGGRFDGTVSRLKAIRHRVDRVMEQTGRRNFCTIIWLSITFFVLTVLVVIT